jgi:hypothetical protein
MNGSKPQPQGDAGRPSRGTLEILGSAGTRVTVLQLSLAPAAARRIFEGSLPASGRLRLRVPRATLRASIGPHEATLDFTTGASRQRVDVRT